jgi:hypothetical protein
MLAFAFASTPAAALAQEYETDGRGVSLVNDEPSPWDERPWCLELTLGIATPTGLAGVVLDRSFGHVSTSLGVGTNLRGIEAALQTRLRLRDRSPSFYVGGGVSVGRHVQFGTGEGVAGIFTRLMSQNDHSGVNVRYEWDRAFWANLELGVEQRGKVGGLRLFTGAALLLNRF